MEARNQLSNTLTFSWRNVIFSFWRRRRNKNCGRDGQQTVSCRQKHVQLRRTEIINKTVHQPSNHCNWILSLAPMRLFPHVFVISLTLETHVLFDTRIGCEELPTMMFQQIVLSFREEARITRCHKQFSTTTFLLRCKITQLDGRPAGTFCRPVPKNVTTTLQDCCRILDRKTVEKSVWLEDCNVSISSDAQLRR